MKFKSPVNKKCCSWCSVCVNTGKCFVWFTFHNENNHFDGILNGLHEGESEQSEHFARSSSTVVVTEEMRAKTNSSDWQHLSAFQWEVKIQSVHPAVPVPSQNAQLALAWRPVSQATACSSSSWVPIILMTSVPGTEFRKELVSKETI